MKAWRKPPTEKAVPEFCLNFAEIAEQRMNREARRKGKDITQLASAANIDPVELRRHVKRVSDCK